MTDREKLTELIYSAIKNVCCVPMGMTMKEAEKLICEQLAGCLLVNGVIIPPCKVGDKLYCIIDGLILDEESFVSEETVSEVGSRGYWLSGCVGGGDDMAIFEPWETIGKTAFRSREEAEKALKANTPTDTPTDTPTVSKTETVPPTEKALKGVE